MPRFLSFYGTVTMINEFVVNETGEFTGCYKLMTVTNQDGSVVNFVVSPTTYFVDHMMITVGDRVTGFYDGNAPVPFIYPPQYQAIVIAKDIPYQNVIVDYFDNNFVSSNGQLKLNIANFTPILLPNNQPFTSNPANRNLLVQFGPTTKSIPAQTTPYKVVVMCV